MDGGVVGFSSSATESSSERESSSKTGVVEGLIVKGQQVGGAPPITLGLVMVSEVEVLSKIFVQDVQGRHPRPLFRSISLPVDEVLKASPLSTLLTRWRTVKFGPRRQRRSNRVEMAFMDRLDLGYVEGRMNPHGAGKS